MTKILRASAFLLATSAAFAKAPVAADVPPAPPLPAGTPDVSSAPAPAVPPAPAAAPVAAAPAVAKPARVPVVLTDIVDGIAIPEAPKSANRGGKAAYPFEALGLNQSFGVTNKTLKQVNSTVATANKRQKDVPATNADGSPKLANVGGNMVQAFRKEKEFTARAVDPATDPAKASVRVWRIV